jgi:SAM-dependent methyltransferase
MLRSLAARHPSAAVRGEADDLELERVQFQISLAYRPGARVCDVGGGLGLFSLGCAALGMQAVLVDDFADPVNEEEGDGSLALHRELGVEVVKRDAVHEGLGVPGPFDVVTSFDSMEHWHHSPKALFREVRAALRVGGRFVLGVPNCVNLRKRITVPFGRGKWTSMEDWYEPPRFRGHVREPDVGDLRYIARDMELRDVRVLGRNWLGYRNRSGAARAVTLVLDHALRAFPGLCSDIYLVGTAPP